MTPHLLEREETLEVEVFLDNWSYRRRSLFGCSGLAWDFQTYRLDLDCHQHRPVLKETALGHAELCLQLDYGYYSRTVAGWF